MSHGVGGMGMKGIFQDIVAIVRPEGSAGETLPAMTVEVDMSNKTLGSLAAIALGTLALAKFTAKK